MPAVETFVASLTKYDALTTGALYHSVVPPEVTFEAKLIEPLQMVCDEALSVGVDGSDVTVMVELAVFVHPFPSVPVTVYVRVAVAEAITLLPVVADNSVDGSHE